ncbi:MAG: adenylyltransferase/cytidyltransferase family protein [Bacillota bacterium]
MLNKIKQLTELSKIIEKDRNEGKVIVLANGCFDLLHVGHIRLLAKAKELGDILVVAVNSDRTVRCLKGETRPVINQAERLELVASLAVVDYVALFDELVPISIVNTLRPDVFVKGFGYSPEQLPEYSLVLHYGGRVVTFGSLASTSTSGIIQKILHGK